MKPHHRARALRISALAALLSVPAPALAGGFMPSAGVQFTWSPGALHGAFGLSVRASGLYVFNGEPGCSNYASEPMMGAGPTVSAGWRFGGPFRLGLSATAAATFDVSSMGTPDLGLEAGVAVPLDGEHKVGPTAGALVSMPFLAGSVSTAPTMGEAVTLGAGLLVPRLNRQLSQCFIIEGRPARDAHGEADGGAVIAAGELSEEAAAWADDARQEAASVPAFLQLARELAALGAPDALVDAALDAAEQEVVHALSAAAVAQHKGGVAVRPVVPETPMRGGSPEEIRARLVAEAWVDGVLGEGAAAAQAREALHTSEDPVVQAHQARIARDEAGHAALGTKVLRWALETDRDATVADLEGLVDHEASEGPEAPAMPGRLGSGERDRVAQQAAARARQELRRLLEAA